MLSSYSPTIPSEKEHDCAPGQSGSYIHTLLTAIFTQQQQLLLYNQKNNIIFKIRF
jgi:hypothetical protein